MDGFGAVVRGIGKAAREFLESPVFHRLAGGNRIRILFLEVIKPLAGFRQLVVGVREVNNLFQEVAVRDFDGVAHLDIIPDHLLIGGVGAINFRQVRPEIDRLGGNEPAPKDGHLHGLINDAAQRDQVLFL